VADLTTQYSEGIKRKLVDLDDGTYADAAGPVGFAFAHLAAVTTAVTNHLVTSTNMKVGAYTLANTTMPTAGGRKITATITAVTGNDTPGTLTIVGTGMDGEALTEVLTLIAASTATTSGIFKTVSSITGAGWVINTGNDTIVVGVAAGAYLAERSGILHAVNVNTTAAGSITIEDSTGVIAILKSSIVEGLYLFDCRFTSWLKVTQAAASDSTITYLGA
jgi:hypothetical protein